MVEEERKEVSKDFKQEARIEVPCNANGSASKALPQEILIQLSINFVMVPKQEFPPRLF